MPNQKSPMAYPFPPTEDPRQTKWWEGMEVFDRRQWWHVLRAMTAEERQEFHADRRATAGKYALESDATADGRTKGGAYWIRAEHEKDLLLRYWSQRLGNRLASKVAA